MITVFPWAPTLALNVWPPFGVITSTVEVIEKLSSLSNILHCESWVSVNLNFVLEVFGKLGIVQTYEPVATVLLVSETHVDPSSTEYSILIFETCVAL